jgi:hypothetical protein
MSYFAGIDLHSNNSYIGARRNYPDKKTVWGWEPVLGLVKSHQM